MADIKQIKVRNTTYNIEPYTNYLPLTGGTLTGKLYINASLSNPGASDPSLAINYSTSAQTISEANLNMIKFGSLDNYIGEAPASRTIEGIPAFAFHTTMGNNSEFAWLSAGWDHRMSLGAGGLTLHKGKLTLVDNIVYKGAKSSGSIIKFINNTADEYGNGIRIGGGGATIIGGGESADLPSVSGGDEVLYLMNDGNIDFYSNCQDGLGSAKHMTFDTAGTLNVPTNVAGSSNSNRLIFRHLDGQNCYGDYNLYLQYHQQTSKIYLNGSTYYIENGYYYNGISEQANLINPHQNVSSTGRSTWSPSGTGKVIWGQNFVNNTISNDTGDLVLSLRPSVYSSGNTELCMHIDGDYYSNGNKVIHSGNIGSQSVNYANGAEIANYANSAGSANSVAWGNVTGKPSTFPATVDSSLSSSSSNPVRNSVVYSAISHTICYDHNYYSYGDSGSWRIQEYDSVGNTLDIRYGKVAINAQEKTYSVSFKKSLNNSDYTIVCGIYRSDRNSWFWSPLVKNRTANGFNVYVRGNTSGDNSGTLLYIAIRSN